MSAPHTWLATSTGRMTVTLPLDKLAMYLRIRSRQTGRQFIWTRRIWYMCFLHACKPDCRIACLLATGPVMSRGSCLFALSLLLALIWLFACCKLCLLEYHFFCLMRWRRWFLAHASDVCYSCPLKCSFTSVLCPHNYFGKRLVTLVLIRRQCLKDFSW